MIGRIQRTSKTKPQTRNELDMLRLRDQLTRWSKTGQGLDFPATPTRRFEIGEKIFKLKNILIRTGLYKKVEE